VIVVLLTPKVSSPHPLPPPELPVKKIKGVLDPVSRGVTIRRPDSEKIRLR